MVTKTIIRGLFFMSAFSSLQSENVEADKYINSPVTYGNEKQINSSSFIDSAEVFADTVNKTEGKRSAIINEYSVTNDDKFFNGTKEPINSNIIKDVAKEVITQLRRASNVDKLMEHKDEIKLLRDNSNNKEFVTEQDHKLQDDLLIYKSVNETGTNSYTKQENLGGEYQTISNRPESKNSLENGESNKTTLKSNETSNFESGKPSLVLNFPTAVYGNNPPLSDFKDNINTIYRRQSVVSGNLTSNKRSPLDDKINKELKTTPSEYSDSSQMGLTVTGNLAAKIVQASLKEVRTKIHLSHFLGDALPKDDIDFTQGSNLSDDLYKLEEDGFHTRSEKTLKQIGKMVEHLISEEITKKSCRMLPSELNEFLVWLVSPEENTRQENMYVYQDNFLFHKMNNKDTESKNKQNTELKNCKFPKCPNSKNSRRTLSKNDIRFHINMAKRVLKEHNYLSEEDKIKAQSVYEKLQGDMDKLKAIKNKAFRDRNVFETRKYSNHNLKPIVKTSESTTGPYWYTTISDYDMYEKDPTAERYRYQYMPDQIAANSPDKKFKKDAFTTPKSNGEFYQYISTLGYDIPLDDFKLYSKDNHYFYAPGVNMKVNEESLPNPTSEKNYRYGVMPEDNYEIPSVYENVQLPENPAMIYVSKPDREEFAITEGNAAEVMKSRMIKTQLEKLGLDSTNLQSQNLANDLGDEYEPIV